MEYSPRQAESPWPHRLAMALCCATFPLVWVGGLVTTHDAGMAVSDWPNTFGYNLFLYPWPEWFNGPFSVFIEHAHRLFAAAVGVLCIAFVVVTWRADPRRWMRLAALAALLLVIGQGVLGGMRLLFDERTLAMIHGCVGPLFFAYCVVLATCTSRNWCDAADFKHTFPRGIVSAALTTLALAYVQLLLGAQLRHIGATAAPGTFRSFVVFHLIGAGALLMSGAYLAGRTSFGREPTRWLRRPAICLAAIVFLQIGLGGAAWVVNYGWPGWLGDSPWAARLLVGEEGALNAKGRLHANLTTAHVAAGSLILGVAALVAARACRLRYREFTFAANWATHSGVTA